MNKPIDLKTYDPALVRDNLSNSPLVQGVINNSKRRTNRRNRAIDRERDLLRRDLMRGHNTRRVKRYFARAGRGVKNPLTFRV